MTRKRPDSRASQPNEYQKLQAEVARLQRALFDTRKAWLNEGMQSNQYKAQRDAALAEVDMLRGVDCSADGDGSCGVCIKCMQAACAALSKQLDDAREQAGAFANMRDELWEQYQDACLYVHEYLRNKWGHADTLKKYAFLNTDGEKKLL